MCFMLWGKIMEQDTVHVMILKNINIYRTNKLYKFDVYIIYICYTIQMSIKIYLYIYTLIGFNTKLAPCSVKLSDGKAWWDWQGSCTNFSSSLSPVLVVCKHFWFHQKLVITNTGWSTVMLDTLLNWESGWISFYKFLINHDVMKFIYVWHFWGNRIYGLLELVDFLIVWKSNP